ncbi:MAG: RNA 3'-terminal phosphate cyclase [Nitrososphaerales archaeon]|nr:RNA 3'-terminal phosphate cyclase [Nitrososphaerales archaeon]
METVEVDGSFGEGGGQILRTAVTFSIALHRPIHVTKIRSGREVPGLRQQHASVLEILRDISGAELKGCRLGSTEVSFVPGTGRGGSFSFDLKTAASITLVLQAVVPAVALSGLELSLDLIGGTDVPLSPTFDYFSTVLRHGFGTVGINFTAKASSRGYYPRGGGRVTAEVEKCGTLRHLTMLEQGPKSEVTLISRCGKLPEHIARRQLDSAADTLASKGVRVGERIISQEPSASPGSSVLICDLQNGRVVGSDAIGARGKRVEQVGAEAAEGFADAVAGGACVDSHLADMIAPVLALAKNESRLMIPGSTTHLETNLHVAKIFTGCNYHIDVKGASSKLTITPGENAR